MSAQAVEPATTIGPDGCYIMKFSDDYFTDRYENEWGEAINIDGPRSGPVREFFIANAGYWVDEYHLDGLRLDATQSIQDGPRARRHFQAGARGRPRASDRDRGGERAAAHAASS